MVFTIFWWIQRLFGRAGINKDDNDEVNAGDSGGVDKVRGTHINANTSRRRVDKYQDGDKLFSGGIKKRRKGCVTTCGFEDNDITTALVRLRRLVFVSLLFSAIPLFYCMVVVYWVKSSSPHLVLNCVLYSAFSWCVVYLGYKGAVLKNLAMLWAHSLGGIAITLTTGLSVFFFFAPGVLLSHFITTVDFPKDENWWVVIVIMVTILVLVFVFSVLLLQFMNLYTAYLAFWLCRELKGSQQQSVESFLHLHAMESGFLCHGSDFIISPNTVMNDVTEKQQQ